MSYEEKPEQDGAEGAPSGPTPKKRVLRSILQTLVGVAVAVPAAILALGEAVPDLDPAIVGWTGGISAVFVILASAAQNAWDSAHGKG
jgi:hypothetical protein